MIIQVPYAATDEGAIPGYTERVNRTKQARVDGLRAFLIEQGSCLDDRLLSAEEGAALEEIARLEGEIAGATSFLELAEETGMLRYAVFEYTDPTPFERAGVQAVCEGVL